MGVAVGRAAALCALCVHFGCYRMLPDRGGGKIKPPQSRPTDAADIALPDGYEAELVARGLTFPTSVTFDDAGRLYVVESGYAYGEVFHQPRLLRVDGVDTVVSVATGENNGPWTGVMFHDGAFYVAEGGEMRGGAILRISPDGTIRRLVENLPTGGDHHANGPAFGPDGKLYFSLGTMTNSAVVGEDNYEVGWLKRNRDGHDIPCQDVVLTGENFESKDPFGGKGKVQTGPYLPFGTPSTAGQTIKGQVPCSGAVLRVGTDGGTPELVGWGFRNPFGLAFTPDGKLLVSDNGYDDRGSRPVWGNADWLWVVDPASPPRWHGWPDYADGRSLEEKRYKGPNDRAPKPVIAQPPNEAPQPSAFFPCHASADGLDVSRSDRFGFPGSAFVALFGDQAPFTGKVAGPVGFEVVRVDPSTGVMEAFAVNRGKHNGPASKLHGGGLERPVSVRFSRNGEMLYIVDFGVLTMSSSGSHPQDGTGVIWRVRRRGQGT